MTVRLQKFLSDAGVASRRASEKLILTGAVTVNGTVVTRLGTKITAGSDQVAVNGLPVRTKRKLYVALNKPAGVICTRHDPDGRVRVGELLPAEWGDLYPVGRLDRETEGLLLLTNDGQFCLHLTHPRYGIRRHYVAHVVGKVTPPATAALLQGVRVQGEFLQAAAARVVSANASHSVVELELCEGRNREVRRLFEAIGHPVSRLRRVQVGPIKLGELKPGRWRVLSEAEVNALRRTPAAPKSARPPRRPRRLPSPRSAAL